MVLHHGGRPMNYGAGNWRRIRKQQLSASLITENPKYKRDEKHKLNITIPLSYLSLRGRGKICLEKVGAHVLLLLSRKVRNDLIMFVNQLANSGMNCPKRIRNRTLRLAKMCRIRIWKQPLALIKNFHLTSLGHKKASRAEYFRGFQNALTEAKRLQFCLKANIPSVLFESASGFQPRPKRQTAVRR